MMALNFVLCDISNFLIIKKNTLAYTLMGELTAAWILFDTVPFILLQPQSIAALELCFLSHSIL